jgi:hypothetical protein
LTRDFIFISAYIVIIFFLFPGGGIVEDQGAVLIAEAPLPLPLLQADGGPIKGVAVAHQPAADIQHKAQLTSRNKMIPRAVVEAGEVEEVGEEGLAHRAAAAFRDNALSLQKMK